MTPKALHLQLQEAALWVCSSCGQTSHRSYWKEQLGVMEIATMANQVFKCPKCGLLRTAVMIYPAFKFVWEGPPMDVSPCDNEMHDHYWFCQRACPGLIKGRCCFHGFELAPDLAPEIRMFLHPDFERDDGAPPVSAMNARKIIIKGEAVKDGPNPAV